VGSQHSIHLLPSVMLSTDLRLFHVASLCCHVGVVNLCCMQYGYCSSVTWIPSICLKSLFHKLNCLSRYYFYFRFKKLRTAEGNFNSHIRFDIDIFYYCCCWCCCCCCCCCCRLYMRAPTHAHTTHVCDTLKVVLITQRIKPSALTEFKRTSIRRLRNTS
jgi:hypothetical protein